MNLLKANGLRFAHPGRPPAIHDVGLQVAPGEMHMVIGPNGSGKTTLLRLLAGLLAPATGAVLVRGRPIRSHAPRRLARTLAYVPQNPPPDVALTVRELALLGRAPHQGLLGLERPGDTEAVARAMAWADVDQFAHTPVESLSGGERQRAFLAKALCQEASLLLLDEPTAALDPGHGLSTMARVAGLCSRQNVAAVVASHDLNLTLRHAHAVTLLHQGRMIGQGPPEEVIVPEGLREAYGCDFVCFTDDRGDRYITPRLLECHAGGCENKTQQISML